MNRLEEEVQVNGETKTDPVAEARKLLADEQQRRGQQCMAEANAVLEKYGFALGCELGIQDGRIVGRAVIVPKG